MVPAKKEKQDPDEAQPGPSNPQPQAEPVVAKKSANVETLSLDDDDDDYTPTPSSSLPPLNPVKSKSASKEVDYVTLDSDDEDDVIAPPPDKRARYSDVDVDSDFIPLSDSLPASYTNSPSAEDSSTKAPVAPGRTAPGSNGSSSPEIICLDDD